MNTTIKISYLDKSDFGDIGISNDNWNCNLTNNQRESLKDFIQDIILKNIKER